MHNNRLHKLNRIATWLIAGMAVTNVAWLIATKSTWDEIVFRGLQYVAMLLIMNLPRLLRSRFRIEVPWLLSVFIVVFCFSSLIMGDGLDLYGRVPWWDKLLHHGGERQIHLFQQMVPLSFSGHVLARSWCLLGDYGIQLRQPYGHEHAAVHGYYHEFYLHSRRRTSMRSCSLA